MTVKRFCVYWALVVIVAAAVTLALGAAPGPTLFIAVMAVAGVVWPMGIVVAMYDDKERRDAPP